MDGSCEHGPAVFDRHANLRKYAAWEQLEEKITELWAYLSVATYEFLTLVAEFDREKVYERHGLISTAQWLNWWCGIDKGTAREKVRVARALENLPLISAGFKSGEFSYSKVRAMTRVATPANEHVFVNVARYGTATHVEKLVKKYRWTQERDAARASNAAHLNRYLHYYSDDADNVLITAKLPPEIGALFEKAMQVAGDILRESADREPRVSTARDDVSAGTWAMREREESHAARRADALKLIAETFLACRSDDIENVANGDRYQVVVHVDQAVLSATTQPSDSEPHRAELDAGPALAISTIRRLACNAAVVGVVDGEHGEPLSIGRKTRAIPAGIERALRARDGGCRFPGCDRTRFTHAHHIVHWADGGETSLANLVTLCSFHHRLVHEGGFNVRRTDDGVLVFTRPDGARIPEARPPATACNMSTAVCTIEGRSRGNVGQAASEETGHTELERHVQSMYPEVAITPRTAACKWTGERMDYSTAIESAQWHDRHFGGGGAAMDSS